MDEKVSIIIPVYNAEATIEKCLYSVLNGRYKNIEVIIVNDCSTDNSNNICSSLRDLDDRVVLINNSHNMGVSKTRNVGLEQVTGKYIMFLDSDDWVESEYVDMHVTAISKYDVSMAVSGYVNEDLCGTGVTERFGFGKEEVDIPLSFSNEALDIFHNRLLQQLWNKIFIAEIIHNNHLFFDESISIGEDFRFILSYVRSAKNKTLVKLYGYPYHYMRVNKNSLMNSVGKERIEEQLVNLRLLYESVGMSEGEICTKIDAERKVYEDSYAYLIMHNTGMKMKDKRKYILKISPNKGKSLFWNNYCLLLKERLRRISSAFVK